MNVGVNESGDDQFSVEVVNDRLGANQVLGLIANVYKAVFLYRNRGRPGILRIGRENHAVHVNRISIIGVGAGGEG